MENKLNSLNLEPIHALFGKEFVSFPTALNAAKQTWQKVIRSIELDEAESIGRITLDLVESSNPLLSYLKPTEKKAKSQFFFLNWLGFNKTTVSFLFDDINGALQKCESICSSMYEVLHINEAKETELQSRIRELEKEVENLSQNNNQPIDEGERDSGKTVPFEQFEELVKSYNRILGDAYSFRTDPNGKMVIRSAIINLEDQGYEVVDYDGSNDEDFRVEFESSISEPHVVSPSIRRESDKKVVEKGLVYKPRIRK